jgi:hypothetical protein
MKPQPIVLHFWPGEGAAVRDLRAMRARPDNPEFVGMRHDDEAGGLVATGEPGRVVVLPEHATLDLAAYAKDVRAGHLVPADEATAAQFGVTFEPRPVAPPEAPEPAAAPASDAPPQAEAPSDVQALEVKAAPQGDAPIPEHPGAPALEEGHGRLVLGAGDAAEAGAPSLASLAPEPTKGRR